MSEVFAAARDAIERSAERVVASGPGAIELIGDHVDFLDALPIGVLIVDTDSRPVYANRATGSMLGEAPPSASVIAEPLRLDRVYRAGTNVAYPADELPMTRALSGERSFVDDIELRCQGRLVPLRVWGVPILGPTGAVAFALMAFVDISLEVESAHVTAAHFAVMQTISSATSFREAGPGIVAGISDSLGWSGGELWLVREGRLVLWESSFDHPDRRRGAAGRAMEMTAGKSLLSDVCRSGEPVWSLDLDRDVAALGSHPVGDAGVASAVAVPLRFDDLTLGAMEFFVPSPSRPAETIVRGLTAIAGHVAQFVVRVAAEETRRRGVDDLVRSQEAERKRIAEEIHDDTLQMMAALGLRLGTLRRFIQTPHGVETLRRVDETLHLTIVRLRHLMFQLWPRSLEDRGLAVACQESLDQLIEAGAINDYGLDVDVDPELPDDLRLALYRVIQELLRNVEFHAQARRVDLSVAREGGAIRVRVRDNGTGFDVPASGTDHGRLGFAFVSERVRLLNGRWEVASAPGEGTVVDVWVPEGPPASSDSRGDY